MNAGKMNNLVKKIWNIRCKQELPAGDVPADGGCRRPKWVRCILWCLDRLVDVCFWLCLLVVAYVVLQLFVLTSFRIPSKSMIPTLVPGDRILVDKLSGGARLFNVFDALEKKDISIWRMPGWRDFQRGDVLVFNFPYGVAGRWDSIAFDVMKYYVKRCIAVPGDTVEIRGGFYHIPGVEEPLGNQAAQAEIAQLPDSGVRGVQMETYPWDRKLGWTVKNFGPLAVPRKGQTVRMDSTACRLYRTLVSWEQKKQLHTDSTGGVRLGDSLITHYTFRENYYFVAGDRAMNSQDSRYWGLLPEPYIVGRARWVWKSVDRNGKVRWERVMKRVK